MKALLTPLLFLAVGAGVLGYNRTHTDRVVSFPFIDTLVPSSKGDLHQQGLISGAGLMGLGALMLLFRTRRFTNQDE